MGLHHRRLSPAPLTPLAINARSNQGVSFVAPRHGCSTTDAPCGLHQPGSHGGVVLAVSSLSALCPRAWRCEPCLIHLVN